MRISANDIKLNDKLDYQGGLWVVIKNPEHVKPGKGPAYIQVEMKNLFTGSKLNHRFGSSDPVEKASIEQKEMQYLYAEEQNLVFMDQQSFEQLYVSEELAGDKLPLLTDGMEVTIEFYQDKPIGMRLPTNITVEIEQTDPVIKGATASASYKPAILTNGIRVMVPPYLTTGEKIVIKTEDFTFVERAK